MFKKEENKYKKEELLLKIRVFVRSKILREKDIFDKKKPEYLSFYESRKFITALQFKNKADAIEYLASSKLKLVPKNPRELYTKRGWWGFGDFIGICPKDDPSS
ncbi:MAG: hypothetical protein WC141_10570 [Arcobacteraceae bacterium]